MICILQKKILPIPMASRSKTWVCGRSPAEIVGSNPTGDMDVSRDCCVLSRRGLCEELITRLENPYRLWCVIVCNLETSWMRRPWPAGGCCAKRKKEENTSYTLFAFPVSTTKHCFRAVMQLSSLVFQVCASSMLFISVQKSWIKMLGFFALA